MTEPLTYVNIVDIVNSLGIVGVLLWLVFLFLKGEIINKATLDKILAVYEKEMANMVEKILARMETLCEERERRQENK